MFYLDEHFIKDGRNIGIASGFVITNRLTHSLWTPLECGWEEARKRTKREFIVDEYCLSRNLARYNLKWTGLHYCEAIKDLFIHCGVEVRATRIKKKKNEVRKN